jgi:hypothetical protein
MSPAQSRCFSANTAKRSTSDPWRAGEGRRAPATQPDFAPSSAHHRPLATLPSPGGRFCVPFRPARSASKRFFAWACPTGVIFSPAALTLDQIATQRRLIVDVPRRPERFAWRRVFDAVCGFAAVPPSLSPRRSSFALHGDACGLAIGGEFGSASGRRFLAVEFQ